MQRSNARNEDAVPGGSTRSPAASRRRRPHRAPLALASLAFLFVLGLGQITTIAIAGELGTEPVATESTEASTSDAPADEEVAIEDGEIEADSSDPADSTGSSESTDTTESTEGGVEAEASSDTDADASSEDDATETDSETDTSKDGDATTTTEADTPGPASGDGVTPILIGGNPGCATVMGDDFLFEVKHEPVVDATIPLSFEVDGTTLTGTLIIDVNESEQTVDFTLTGDFVAAGVIVKGGPNANFYDYRPDGNASDTGLHAPVNPNNDQFYGLSHLSFCFVEGEGEGSVAAIDVEKDCPGSVDAGETIEYTLTVTNTGTEALTDITVEDSLLGDITADFDVDLSAGLAVGASATATVTYQPGPDEDPVENTVTATGTGVDSQDTDSDTATCETDVVHATEIDVEKSCTDSIEAGGTIEYTITVTNTGTEALTDITVDDSLLGDITVDFDPDLSAGLAVGASATAVVTFQPGAGVNRVENTVTATGTGVDSQDTDSDTATCVTLVESVLGGGGENQPPGGGPGIGQAPPVGGATGGTAFTGSDTWIWALIAGALALFGVALVVATRKGSA